MGEGLRFVYYKNDEDIQKDHELKIWWEEFRTKGHGDTKDKPRWPKMQHMKNTLILAPPSYRHSADEAFLREIETPEWITYHEA
nr:probable linoleate 9S-lipoxygenase 5 [Tanacetum cinerariifolium]